MGGGWPLKRPADPGGWLGLPRAYPPGPLVNRSSWDSSGRQVSDQIKVTDKKVDGKSIIIRLSDIWKKNYVT